MIIESLRYEAADVCWHIIFLRHNNQQVSSTRLEDEVEDKDEVRSSYPAAHEEAENMNMMYHPISVLTVALEPVRDV